MGWICKCGNYNGDGFDKCCVCDEARPPVVLVTLTKRAVQELRLSGEVRIPLEYNVIGDNAFKDRTDIYKVILHENVLKIEAKAFYGCVNLKEIVCLASIEKIGSKAFYNCTSLPESMRIPVFESAVAPDAYGNTLEDLLSTSEKLDESEITDVELTANESPFSDLPSIKKLVVNKGDGVEDEAPLTRLVDKDFKKAEVETEEPHDFSEESTPLAVNVDLSSYDAFIEKTKSKADLDKKVKNVFADISAVAFVLCLISTLFFFVSNCFYWFNNSNELFLISSGLAINFLVYTLCALLGLKTNILIEMWVNSAIGLLLAVLCVLSYYYVPSITLLSASLCAGLFISSAMLAFSYYKEVYCCSDFNFILTCALAGVSLAGCVWGFIIYFV